ncbi:unnamed protein product [Zymoseptoria tritici ST99CH_1E4]|uniref:Methyltransferase domain-containing protein n=1 Tax=Zymoseptoria tritici ST99CH_1E4 TaxID=1276532 RepID=A0A2H1H0Q9_ZYMTR|nr:unnamed protein product [Zymoseptoria tritici ST99CH_1E4]
MASNKPDAAYPLAQGIIDSVRLNAVHFLWKKEFPWVLSSATDTCGRIWLLEASEEFPEADRLDGLDVVIDQAPPKHLLPANVHFEYLDAHADIPQQYLERYDLINAKFLLGLVRDGNPNPLIKRLLQMLKPAGYIQWSETDWATDTYIGLSENNMTKDQSGLHRLRASGARYLAKDALAWPMKLPTLLADQGVTDIVEERTTLETFDRKYGRAWTEVIVAAAIDGLGKLPEGEMKDEMVKLIEAAKEDAKKGIAWVADHLVVVGRKAKAEVEAEAE